MARGAALAAAIVVSLLVVSGAGGSTAQTPKRGGTIVVLRPELPCLNPFTCNVNVSDPTLMQVLEGAFEAGPDLVLRPNLVSDVDIGTRPFTLTYHIRPEARWSDGVPVTASDFSFTQSVFARQPMVGGDFAQGLHRRVSRARVLDAKTFRIELREPFAGWRDLFHYVLPRHVLAGRDLTETWIDRIDNPRTGVPIGSGPFLVASLERGRQLTLVRNHRYWGPHTAYLDRLVFRFVRSDQADPLGPVRRDEFDVALTLGGPFVSADHAREIRRMPGWRVLAWPATVMEHLVFRVGPGGHPALGIKLVRQALAFGIDRVAIVHEILAEADPSARRPMDSAVFQPTEPFYRPNWSRYRYDPARAQRLLGQAGCRRGSDGIYSCAGERLSLRIVTTAGDPVRAHVLQLVQQDLRRVGVELVPSFAPPQVVFGQILPGGQFDLGLFAWVVFGGVAWPESRCGDAQNWAGFCSRLIMRDVQQVDVIVKPAQRARVLNAADAKLARAVPVLPLVQPVLRAAVRSTVRGVVPGGSQLQWSQNSEDWWLAGSR